jgi:hypothetical protein
MLKHITIDTKPDGTPITIPTRSNGIQATSAILGERSAKCVSRLQDLTSGALHMLPLRPMKSPELIDAVARAYELTPNGDPIDLGGSSNLNLLFKRGELGYVARIYRAWVTQERLQGIQSVRATLRGAGLPFPQTRPAADGRMFLPFADWLVEVEPCVSGQDMRTWAELLDGMRM